MVWDQVYNKCDISGTKKFNFKKDG